MSDIETIPPVADVTVAALANELDVAELTVRRWARSGKLPKPESGPGKPLAWTRPTVDAWRENWNAAGFVDAVQVEEWEIALDRITIAAAELRKIAFDDSVSESYRLVAKQTAGIVTDPRIALPARLSILQSVDAAFGRCDCRQPNQLALRRAQTIAAELTSLLLDSEVAPSLTPACIAEVFRSVVRMTEAITTSAGVAGLPPALTELSAECIRELLRPLSPQETLSLFSTVNKSQAAMVSALKSKKQENEN